MSTYSNLYRQRWDALENIFGCDVPYKDSCLAFAQALQFANWDVLISAQACDLELQNKLEMLAGPHGHTIWKAIQVRKSNACI